MKRLFVYILCICFPLAIFPSNEIIQSSAINHETCQIRIYSNFSKLKDMFNNNVDYNITTMQGIESLFLEKGYQPVTGFSPNVMSLNLYSAFFYMSQRRDNTILLEWTTSKEKRNKLCWLVGAIITTEGKEPTYSRPYKTCRNNNSASYSSDNYKELTLVAEELYIKAEKSYSDRIYLDAVYNKTSSISSGESLSDSIDAVLLGASDYAYKKYKEIPTDIGILKSLPYCCTPQDNSLRCIELNERKE